MHGIRPYFTARQPPFRSEARFSSLFKLKKQKIHKTFINAETKNINKQCFVSDSEDAVFMSFECDHGDDDEWNS